MVGVCTHLGCVPIGDGGRFRRLVLPLPRLALRHCGTHPQGSGAPEPAGPGRELRRTKQRSSWAEEAPMAGIPHDHYEPRDRRREVASPPTAGGGAALRHDHDPHAEEPELDVDLGHRAVLLPGDADRDRHRAGDALHAGRGPRLRVGRAHHARRQRRLHAALPARERRVAVLHRGLCAHLPQPLLWLVQGAARGDVGHRHPYLPDDDGHGLHGLRAALGADVVLGRHCHHRPLRRDPVHRTVNPDLAARRPRSRQLHADAILLAALPVAVPDPRALDPQGLGVPQHRQQQPLRGRGAARSPRPSPSATPSRSGPTS